VYWLVEGEGSSIDEVGRGGWLGDRAGCVCWLEFGVARFNPLMLARGFVSEGDDCGEESIELADESRSTRISGRG